MIDIITTVLQAGGGGIVQQSSMLPESFIKGFFGSIPWDQVWSGILVTVGAMAASFAAWWKSLSVWQQITIAGVGIVLVGLVVL